jgi:lysophospholipase L1-like esterase
VGHPLLGKTTGAVLVMLGLLAVPYATPRLSDYRIARSPFEPAPSEEDVSEIAISAPVLSHGETELRASSNEATVTNALPTVTLANATTPAKVAVDSSVLPIHDPTGRALDAFYAQLARTKAKQPGAVTRILHYGDSVITADYLSGTVRRRMQAQFGDGGHGFILIANPWEWYFHNDVTHGAGEGWKTSRVVGPLTRDAMYGIGAVTFTGRPGASAWFGTAAKGSHGKKVSRFDVYYLETEHGGEVEAKVGSTVETFSTKGSAESKSRIKSISVPDGEAKLTLKVVKGAPRLFGVALERDVPGVVYDALGMNGGRADSLNTIHDAHFAEQMALRKPALVMLQFGANESEAPGLNAPAYERSLRALVEKIKRAAPGASIVIVSPLDRAEKSDRGLRTKPVLKKLVSSQKNVAEATGVGFWSTYEAMGGEGSMAKWVKKGLGGSDLTHPSAQGAEILGDMLHKALVNGFSAWQAKRTGTN